MISYTHAQCTDASFTACQLEGERYRIVVSGSGVGQNAAPACPSSCNSPYLSSLGTVSLGCREGTSTCCTAVTPTGPRRECEGTTTLLLYNYTDCGTRVLVDSWLCGNFGPSVCVSTSGNNYCGYSCTPGSIHVRCNADGTFDQFVCSSYGDDLTSRSSTVGCPAGQICPSGTSGTWCR